MDAINQAFQSLYAPMQQLAVPLAVVGVIFTLLAFLVSPLLGDNISSGVKGYIQKAFFCVAIIGFIPSIVGAFASIGGGGGGGDGQIIIPVLFYARRIRQFVAKVNTPSLNLTTTFHRFRHRLIISERVVVVASRPACH